MRREYAEFLIDKTRADYNLIAEHFSSTRTKVPEEFSLPLEYIKKGAKVLDLGCANGALSGILKDVNYVGVDNSEKLIAIAKQKFPQVKFYIADSLRLPFKKELFDVVFCIGVLHHIPSLKIRLEFLKEARRVLKKDGKIVLRVWDIKAPALLVKYALLKILGRSKLDFKDIFYPWKNSGRKTITERYFHCFSKKELVELFRKAGFKVEKTWKEGSNIYIVGRC
ncbi:methyltransferase domain-containing protein [Patescibacteria group bacterium]|nr:methyltransferase domain-containing protein [Patescibacteria group bacterium]